MKKLLLLIGLSLVLSGTAGAAKIVHLDATRPDTVVGATIPDPVDPNFTVDVVSEWLDLSGAGNDAVADAGDQITYPSSYVGSGGFPGVNFTGGSYKMDLLTVLESDALLDFTGDASGNSGFAMFVAVMRDPAGATHNIRDVLGNSSQDIDGVGMRHKEGGDLTAWVKNAGDTRGAVIDEDETFVHAMNYDASTGAFTISSLTDNDALETVPLTAAAGMNLSTSLPLSIGHNDSTSRHLEGFVGEVVIYNEVLSTADFEYQFDVLKRKWVEARAVAPVDDGTVPLATSVQLNWENLLPNTPGEDVYVDVWFGTDPGSMSLEVDGVANITTTTVTGLPLVEDTYYWAVNTSFGSALPDGDPGLIEGPVYSFLALADTPPTVTASDWTTWPNTDTPIEATVVDEGSSQVTVTFSSDDPNLLFDGLVTQSYNMSGGGGTVTANASIDYIAPDVTVTITAEDTFNVAVDSYDMTLAVYRDGCQAARQDLNGIALNPEDLAVDCKFDLADFRLIAAEWLTIY